MTASALLNSIPKPSDAGIDKAMAHVACRCATDPADPGCHPPGRRAGPHLIQPRPARVSTDNVNLRRDQE